MGITKVNDLAAVFVATVLLLSICPANGGIYRSQDALIFKIDRAVDGSFSPKLFPIKQSDFLPINFFLIGGLINPAFLPELNRPRKNTNLYYSNIGPHHPLQELNLYNWLILHPFIFEGVRAAAAPPALNSSKDQQTFNHEFKQKSSIPCGVGPNPNRIVNGQEAVPNSWPFVVGFKTLGSNTVFCGGSLISDTEILTAAHCFERLSLYQLSRKVVKLGMHDRGNDDGEPEDALETIKISSLTIHRMFNRRSFDYDVAIITIEQPVTYSSAISRVCLPSGMEQIDDFAGKSANVMGWGTTSFGNIRSLLTNI
ncbi:hypothetical protein OUZ56_010782 [Daphnia magna]|uniref:Peptidase S1 domain-containing protein n=1 Tax=Daphnia magna TaxID=35525 RepID=A0ABQ9YYH1_9CRUS|nr:hypothetical protein OUZ56_010782 [Daphnia magna]